LLSFYFHPTFKQESYKQEMGNILNYSYFFHYFARISTAGFTLLPKIFKSRLTIVEKRSVTLKNEVASKGDDFVFCCLRT